MVYYLGWKILEETLSAVAAVPFGGGFVKNINLLVWLAQLGVSVALPPVLFILLGTWLRDRFDLGSWVVIVAVVLGIVCAIDGLRTSLKAMERMDKDKEQEQPPVSFNDHD